MCYDISSLTKKQQVYVKRFNLDAGSVSDAMAVQPPVFHASGFQHPSVPVMTAEAPEVVQLMEWGLIPFWVKDVKTAVQISNKTLNARLETAYAKPSFKTSMQKRRCLIMVDGFFEHHHKLKKTFPFFIKREDNEPFLLGGIWSRWQDKEKQISRHTFSIITTKGNSLLASIHNNPKLDGPRMPVIVDYDKKDYWLFGNQDEIESTFAIPFDSLLLNAYTVGKIRGTDSSGNRPEAHDKVNYIELM